MTWRYDVYECTHTDADHHDHDCVGHMTLRGEFLDYGYEDAFVLAYDLAEKHGHAAVWTTAPNGSTALCFQHIRGGGPCEACPPQQPRSGPWTRHILGDRFICERCAAQARREWGKSAGWSDSECPWYRPVLRRASAEASR
ncbi:hypothetical protein OG599_09090 [Streptomyces sp. NBC_01335]|uniref:hypothetical protein n=1 Tax=Streptomyces sp. NBC_01335 TaxID=2903828 RepID=UPI002E1363EF|nr:hypothetical protein OG599_09090 [Streptomyces sp. NBC_01335]